MHQDIVPPNKLTASERLLYLGVCYLLLAIGFIVIGMFLQMPWIVGGIAAFACWREMVKRWREPEPTSNIHGSAHFCSLEELESAGLSGRSDGVVIGTLPLSTKPRMPVSVEILRSRMSDITRVRRLLYRYVQGRKAWQPEAQSNLLRLPCSDKLAHLGAYMYTGAGKTWGVVIPNLLCCDENAVVYDPSGETFRETAEFRRSNFGHEVRLIDPFGICGQRQSDRMNVLDLVSPADPACFDYCNHLGHALVVEKPDSRQDPFFHAGTVSGTAFLLHAIMLSGGDKFRNLLSLGELLVAERFAELAKSLSDHSDTALGRRARQMGNFQGKTLSSLLACLAVEHGWMDAPAFAGVMADSTFSVRSLFKRKMTLYIVVPGNRAHESGPFLRTLLTAILYAAFEAGPDRMRPPVRFYLDEAATLGKLDLLMTLYAQGRKYGLRSINFFQSVGQVADIMGGPEKIQNFRANMAGELFKPKDHQTAKEVSDWIGNTTVQTTSTSWQEGSNSGWSQSGNPSNNSWSGGENQGSTTTISETGVLAIRPEEILQLREREAIFVSAGTPPIIVNIIQASEARRLGGSQGAGRYDQYYLTRVRWNAALLLLVLVPVFIAMAFCLLSTGSARW